MLNRTPRAAMVAAIALAGVLLLSGFSAAALHGAGTAPLKGATAAAQPPQCKGYKTYGVPSVTALNPHKTYRAIVTTNKGAFTVTFYPKQAPVTVESFIFLAQHRYFDGIPFHRVLPGFVIQGGDPTGTGLCGPGYQFGTENTRAGYRRGTLAMARAQDPHSNGSQFFVVLKDNTGLSPDYTVFGKVTNGMAAVDRIAAVPLGPNADGSEQSIPKEKVYMKTVRVTAS